ncbi:MAG TPA: oligopeptide/dipeptide ABC transporter ATP-binding protein [Iamia sp.]
MTLLEKDPRPPSTSPEGTPILKVSDLSVSYTVRGRAAGGKSKGTVSAVDGVDLHVNAGETLGLVGESGCGKSTTGRALLGRIPISAGRIEFDGRDITGCSRKEWRSLHRDIQLVFQDPYASLNPRRTVRQIIGEPLVLHKIAKGQALHDAVDELLEMVRLPKTAANRYPHAFSGGQRQRIVIARALALRPRFVVADEPVSALDVSIQAQVVKLLKELQRDLGLSYLFIAHNLAVIRNIADRVAVMYLGHIVETGDRERIYANPLHPYTRALLSAAPIPDPALERPGRIILSGDPPSAIDPPAGCRFHTRCPLVHDRCRVERPPLVDVEPGHQVACFAVTPDVPVSIGDPS